MKVYDVMTQGVESVPPTATVQEAARTMAELRIGALPVLEGERVIGILTDRDLTLRVLIDALDPRVTRVAHVMTPSVEFVFEDQAIEEAVDLMCRKKIGRLLVMNRSGKVVGLLSTADIGALAPGTWQAETVNGVLSSTYWQRHLFAVEPPVERRLRRPKIRKETHLKSSGK